ncbi:hypothetical protein FRC01_009047 [Tulasnella sp. 417]|nr:hypothetical protein FRC01_009047 [Tulasnella sp. 417]
MVIVLQMPPKRKVSQRRSSSPVTLDSIVKANPAAWATLQAAKKESNESFRPKLRSASSSVGKSEPGLSEKAPGSSKPAKRQKLAHDDEEYLEDNEEGSEPEAPSSSKTRSSKRETGRPGRPPSSSKTVKALVILTHGISDYAKASKGYPRPPWDLIVAASMSGLSFIAGTENEIVIERAWTNDEGYQYITSAFPSVIEAVKAKLPASEPTGQCLVPLFWYNKALHIGQGFDGETIFKRLDTKDGWSTRYLFFVTPVRLNERDVSTLSLAILPTLDSSPPVPSDTAPSSSSTLDPPPSKDSDPKEDEHSPVVLDTEPTTDDEVEYVTTQFQSQASFSGIETTDSPPSPPPQTDLKGKGKARQVPSRAIPRFVDPLAAFSIDVPNPHVS